MRIRRVVGALGLMAIIGLLELTGAAATKTSVLYTAVLFSAGNGQILDCEVTNVSGAARNITVQILGESGGAFSSEESATVDNGKSIYATVTSASAYGYCRITVDGLASDVRGALKVVSAANGTAGVALAY